MIKAKKISSKEFDQLHEDLNDEYNAAKSRKDAENLEIEYKCLKALFSILDTKDFKYTDFGELSYSNNFELHELEIISRKHQTHRIVKADDFTSKLKISPYTFVDFLHQNGATNDRAPKSTKARPVGEYLSTEKVVVIPKLGEYYLCSLTGFWKIASKDDIDKLELKRKEALYFGNENEVTMSV